MPIQSMQHMFVFAPHQQNFQATTASIPQLQPVANIPMPDQKICDTSQAIQKILTILHDQEQAVFNPLLGNRQFAQNQMETMGLVNQLQQQHTQETLLDLMFPSRALTANAVAAMETISNVIQDGIQLQSPTLLKDRIDRLAPAIDCITRYSAAAIQDLKALDTLTEQSHDSPQMITNLSDLQGLGADLMNQLQVKYAAAISSQQASVTAFMAQHASLTLCEKIDLAAGLGRTNVQLRVDLAETQKALDQRKATIGNIISELNLYKQGYSTDHLADTAQLFMTELKKGFPGGKAEIQTLSTAQQEAVHNYLQALSNVDAISARLSQQTAVYDAMQAAQLGQRATYDQAIKTGTLQELIATAETLNLQIAQASHAGPGTFVLERYRNLIGSAIESKIYTPAYNQLLSSLRDNQIIIDSPARLEALNKALDRHNLSQIRYTISPELAAYLNAHGISPSEFHIIIADPLRGQLFKENLVLLHKIEQKFPFNAPHDPIIQAKIDALVQANHNAISALSQGDIGQAAAFTNTATSTYIQLHQHVASGNTQAQPQTQPAPSTQTQNSTPGIILDPPVKLGSEVTDKAVDPHKLGHKDPILSTRLLFKRYNRILLQLQHFSPSKPSNRPLPATLLLLKNYWNMRTMLLNVYKHSINALVQSLKRSLLP